MRSSILSLKKEAENIRQNIKNLERSNKIYTLADWADEELKAVIVEYYRKELSPGYQIPAEIKKKIDLTDFGLDAGKELTDELRLTLYKQSLEEIPQYVAEGIFTEEEGSRLMEMAKQKAFGNNN